MSDQLSVIPNTRAGQAPPAPVLKSDNSLFKYRMHFNGFSRIAFADDHAHLCEALIPGYTELDESERLIARLSRLIDVQLHIRANILASLTTKDQTEELEEWQYDILAADERAPHGWGGEGDEAIDFWTPRTPLVLLDADYAPYTDVLPPISFIADVKNPPNILWLRSGSEEDFLESLERVGVLQVAGARNAA